MKKYKIKPLDKYLAKNPQISEAFSNPFDDGGKIEVKPSHIADKGGLLKPRKEVFNINRIEYSKRPNGAYTVLAKTQYAKGEIVEIAPVIFVGSEVKNIDRLKDYVFEIDANKDMYGIVLGYGSIYRHNEKPNITFAYNKSNRQMYFIAARMINAGEELSINYGKDYWTERSGFGTMANQAQPTDTSNPAKGEEANENEIQASAEDLTNASVTQQRAQPGGNMNPVVTGVAIKGLGQQ